MANLPANPGEALWIGGVAGKNFYNVGIGQGTSGGQNHTDFGMDAIEDGYSDPNKFRLNAAGNVEFRINAGAGKTSTNTAHPRSECRELTMSGGKAAWDGRSGEHYLKARCRLIETDGNKPWVCFGQIHGSEGSPEPSDLVRLQTEGDIGATTNLTIVCRRSPPSGGSEIRTVLRTGYAVGVWFDYEIRMSSGTLIVKLDGTEVLRGPNMGQILNYFKFGCYLQDNPEKGASPTAFAGMEFERGSVVSWHSGYAQPSTPVFTGGTDPGGGAGGGAGNDTQAPTVPQNGFALRGDTQLSLTWDESTDNVGVTGYRVYRFSAAGGGGAGTVSGSPTGGSGGPLTDRTSVSYNNGVKTSTYHIYAAGLDWSQPVGLLIYGDGSGEFGLANPSNTYLLAGTNGLVAVAKRNNMLLVTPRAPGNGCTDGDGVCWYLASNDGTTRAQKTKWLDDLIKTQILPSYNVDKTRVCISGFSSGAENTAGIYGPAFAASWMEDGLLLAISYGSSPDQYGITDTYTADFRSKVAVVWDVRGGDETTALADSLEGFNWYTAEGFTTLERNVIAGGAHDRPGEFGTIVEQYLTKYVRAADGGNGSASTLGRDTGGAGETLSSADKIVASRFTAGADGALVEGHFRAWLSASGSTSSKMLVYADDGGAPGDLLAESDEITISSTSESVRDYPFSGADRIDIEEGVDYWVAVAWDDPGTPSLVFSRDVSSGGRVESTATYGTPPDPFGTVSGTFTGPIDAWCDVVSGTGAGTGTGGGTITSFGKTTDGAGSSASSADKTAVSSVVATATGTLVAGHARAWLSAAGSCTTKMVVYANSGGTPGTRLAASDPKVITNTAEQLVDYTFSGAEQVTLTNGTTYWIGLAWVDPDPSGATVALTISRDGTAGGRQEASVYAPASFGTPTALTGPIDAYVDVSSGSGGGAGGGWVLRATVTDPEYLDTGLTNGTTYTYGVSAIDAAGNESARSADFIGIPGAPDTTPPTVPTGLAVTPGDGRLTLTWNPSTDPAEIGEATGVPTGATMEFVESFELGGSTPFSRWNSVQNHVVDSTGAASYNPSTTYSNTIVDGGAGHPTVLRTEVRDGDTAVGSHERAELSGFGKSAMLADSGQERYYEFDVRFGTSSFSPSWTGGANDWLIFFQIHQPVADGAPPLALSMHSDGKVYLEREPDDTPTTDTPLWTPFAGVWYRVTLHVKFSANPAVGFVRIHVDDTEVLPKTFCQTAYTSDPNDNYPKLGTYRRSTVGGTTVVYHDDFRVSSPPETAPAAGVPASGVLRYVIYLDGVPAAQVASGEGVATALVLAGLPNGVQRSVTISAVDRALNESAQSAAVLATPTAPAIDGVPLLPGRLTGGKVEVAIAWGADLNADQGTWTWSDITEDVRFDPGLSIELGRADESSRSNPANVKLVLDNTSGDYSLGGKSARWPYVRRNTPVRVRIDPGDGGGGRIVILAFADGFTPGWDSLRGNIPVVTLSASGSLRRLAQGDAPVTSAYRRVMAASSSVVAYWPMEEGESATYAPALRGGSDFTFTGGEPDWAADDSFDCSAPLPKLSNAYFQADVHPYPNTGKSQVRFLLSVPDGGLPDGSVLAHISMSGTIHRWDITYGRTAEGVENLGLYRYNASDGSLHSSDLVNFTVDGVPCRFSLDWTQVGSNIEWTIGLTPARPGATGQFIRRTLTGRTAGIVTHFELNPHNANLDATIGHITVENDVTSFFTENDALIAHAGDFATSSPSGRLARLCAENGVKYQAYGSGATLSTSDEMGPQLVAPLLDLLYQAEDSDQGQLWDGRSSGLSYTTRRRRELGIVRLTIDAAAGELADRFEPVDDDQRDRNRVTVSRLHGITVTKEDSTGPKGTGEIGIYDDSLTINNGHDAMTAQYAHWFVHLGTVEGYRYPSVTVDLAASPQLAGDVIDIIPGDRIDVVNLDDTLAAFPDDSVSLIVEGIAHEITTRTWRVTFRCSLFDPWGVGEVAEESGDSSDMLLRLDTDGASVSSTASAGATSLSVASTGALWTTDADDYPLHLDVGGVRVRATACTGGTSPQTMTVDALPISRAAGLPVRLWSPRVIGLG